MEQSLKNNKPTIKAALFLSEISQTSEKRVDGGAQHWNQVVPCYSLLA